jgi:NitT/TauT family transport system substrate-binding protein
MHQLTRAQLIAGAAAAAALAPRLAFGQTVEKIRFGGVPTDDLTPIFYAIKNGLYQKAGLDVEFAPTSSGTAATTAVISGAYEMGKGSLIASLLAHIRQLPLVIVGNGALWDAKNPFTQIFVAADSPYKTAPDLNGKTASSPALNDLGELGILAWMDKNGGDSKTLKWVEIPNSVAAVSVAEHRTDVCTLNEPQLHAALESGKLRVVGDLGAVADHFSITVYFANGDWAAKHPDLVKRWVRVTYEAAAYTNTHKAETVAMMSEITKIPAAVFSKMYRVDAATTSDPSLVQAALDTAAKYKNVPRSFPAKDAFFTG